MVTLTDFFKNSHFTQISDESFNIFKNLATIVHYKKNEVLCSTGETPKEFYIVKSGVLRSFYSNEKGNDHIRSLFTKGKTTGPLTSLISDKPSQLTYDCITDCELYQFNFEEFKKTIKINIEIAILYSEVLEYIFLLIESKIYDLSILNATERYLKLKKEIPEIENLIPQYHIASYLNISPVQLSRIRKDIYSK